MKVQHLVVIFLFISSVFLAAASAGQAARLKLAGDLLDAMQMSKTVEDQFAITQHMQKGLMSQMATQMGMPADALLGLEPMQQEIAQVLAHDLSWESIKTQYTEIYASTFSERELRGLIAFYQSPP